MMRCVLIGHPGSQFLVPASRYLVEKYLPDFNTRYVNHEGDTNGWSKFVYQNIKKVANPLVVLSLDDYLISSPMNSEILEQALTKFMDDRVACVKLFRCTEQEHEEYPVTTQYTIWSKRFLLRLLQRTTNPWDFEMNGSRIFRALGQVSVRLPVPAIEYNTSSALSKRWQGVDWKGVSEEDINHIRNNIYDGKG